MVFRILLMELNRLNKTQVKIVNRFYRQCRARGKANKGDEVYVYKEDGNIIAALRLTLFDDEYLLRNLAVLESYRGQGIGSELVRNVIAQSDKTLVTFPFRHLNTFYQSLGFTPIEINDVTREIGKRFVAYLDKGRDIQLMGFRIEHSEL